jgi:hypothetical protein
LSFVYGSIADVAALSRTWTKNGVFDGTTNPADTTVTAWLANISSQMTLAMMNNWFDLSAIPDIATFKSTYPDAFNAITQVVESMVADLVQFVNGTGRFYTDIATKNTGKSVYAAIYGDLCDWVIENKEGLQRMGLKQTLDMAPPDDTFQHSRIWLENNPPTVWPF